MFKLIALAFGVLLAFGLHVQASGVSKYTSFQTQVSSEIANDQASALPEKWAENDDKPAKDDDKPAKPRKHRKRDDDKKPSKKRRKDGEKPDKKGPRKHRKDDDDDKPNPPPLPKQD